MVVPEKQMLRWHIILSIIYTLSSLTHGHVRFDPTLPKPLHSIPLHAKQPHPRRHDRNLLSAELTPLYPGYGTHISYIFVGTPPQRQSVIIDTGSAFTAFPCTSCRDCGQHTNPYFNPKNSSTSKIEKCGLSTCSLSQSYSEGSSWTAYRVTDKLWVGGLTLRHVKDADKYQIDFTFGCQSSVTGLFRTQFADGIMGMSRSSNTLLPQLVAHQVVDNKIFGLCFRIGGGIMTLGGIDQSIHLSDIQYAKLYDSPSNWFRIRVEDMSLVDVTGSGRVREVSVSGVDVMNAGSGTIVDSGTTDTYLPYKLRASFEAAFLAVSGVRYNAGVAMSLTTAQVKSLPSIKLTFTGMDGGHFDVFMPASAYADYEGGKYTFRVYLTEGTGAVLGANFMSKRNIIFDADGGRVGFAESHCDYGEVNNGVVDQPPPFSLPPVAAPIELPRDSNNCTLEPAGYCTAVCDRVIPVERRGLGRKDTNTNSGRDSNSVDAKIGMTSTDHSKASAYVVEGLQSFYDYCNSSYVKRPCVEYCTGENEIARGVNIHCLDSTWSECGKDCKQSRQVAEQKNGHCVHKKEERSCAIDNCPQDITDFFVFADIKFWYPAAVSPRHWEKIYEDDLFSALAIILKVRGGVLVIRGMDRWMNCSISEIFVCLSM